MRVIEGVETVLGEQRVELELIPEVSIALVREFPGEMVGVGPE